MNDCRQQDAFLQTLLSNASNILVPSERLRDLNFGIIIWALGAIIPAGIVSNTINCLVFSRIRYYNRGYCAGTGFLFHSLAVVDVLYLILAFFVIFLPVAFLHIPSVPCVFMEYVKFRVVADRYVTILLEAVRMGAIWIVVVIMIERLVALQDPTRAPTQGICMCAMTIILCSVLTWGILDFLWTEVLSVSYYHFQLWALLITLVVPWFIICITAIPLCVWLCTANGTWHKFPPELAIIQGERCVTIRVVATAVAVVMFNTPLIVERAMTVLVTINVVPAPPVAHLVQLLETVTLLLISVLATFKIFIYMASGADYRFELGCYKRGEEPEEYTESC